jgi:hypothetical protein
VHHALDALLEPCRVFGSFDPFDELLGQRAETIL